MKRASATKPAMALPALIRQLSEAVAVSGDEHAVRSLVLQAVQDSADKLEVDALGTVLATRTGTSRRRERVLAAAHMDEVGVMIMSIESDGLLAIEAVGGLDPRVLLGKQLWVGRQRLPGVVGATPVHLLKDDEEKRPVAFDALRLDIGAGSREAAAKLVQPGDRATFATSFRNLGGTLRGKALDDRVGVALLIELFRTSRFEFDFTAAFTVQEEVGLRGAQAAAFAIDPVAALVLEVTPANDLPPQPGETENVRYNTRLGHGAALSLADSSTLYPRVLVQHFAAIAVRDQIPFQYRQPGGGGNDSGGIQRRRSGIPVVALSVPGRYIHSPAALVRLSDVRAALQLARAALSELPHRPART